MIKSTNYQQEIPEQDDYVDIDVISRTLMAIDKQSKSEETTARTAESSLSQNISDEVARAKKAESTLTTNLSTEVTRAKEVEGTLSSLTTSDKSNLVASINSEVTRATKAEKANADAIASETSTRTKNNTTLQTNIDNEVKRAKDAESTLTTNLNTEITRAKGAEKTLTDNLSAEATRATGAESTLTTNLNNEITRAKGVEGTRVAGTYIKADNTLAQNDTALDTQVKKNTDAITTLNGTGAGSVTKTVSDAVAKVVANAPSDFDTLKEISDQISTHTESASTMNSQIQTNKTDITTTNKAISDEVTRAKGAESTITNNLNSEITRAKGVEKTLTDNLGGHTVKSNVPENAKFTDTVYDDTALKTRVSTAEGNITTINSKISKINNTSDADKPISTATQTALNKKQDAISDLATIRSNASTAKTASEGNAAAIAEIKNSELLNGIETYYALRRSGVKYSVQIPKFEKNQSSTCTKTGINATLKYVPSTDTDAGTDDYENIPMFQWVHVIYKRYSDGSPYPVAIEGTKEYNDLLATGACDVGAMQMSFYVLLDTSNEAYDELTISDLPFDGAVAWSECRRANGDVLPWCIGSSYYSSTGDDGLLRSLPNRKPVNFQSYNNMCDNYPKKGDGYQGAGTERTTFSYIFMTIKGGTKNIQTLYQGCINYSFQYTCAVGEENVKRVIVTTSQGVNFVVDASVTLGTSGSNNDRGVAATYSISNNAKVLSKETVTIDGTEYTAINLDLDKAITTTTNTLISSIHWRSGSTDKVFGHRDGSYVSNTNGKYPFRMQGREYRVGGWDVASDTMFWLTSSGRDVYVWPKGVKHVKNSNTGMTKVGTIPLTSDTQIGDVKFDPITGAYWFSVKGKDSGTGIGDYFYAGGTSTNTLREYLIGGRLWFGSAAGFYLAAWSSLSAASWDCVAAD